MLHGLPTFTFGSDSATAFEVIKMVYFHVTRLTSMSLNCLFTVLVENCRATTLCIFRKVTLVFGFLPFLIVYNTLKLLLKLIILVKIRAVFCMNLQNWSCVSLLAATHSQISCALMLEMHLPKLDIPSLQSALRRGISVLPEPWESAAYSLSCRRLNLWHFLF